MTTKSGELMRHILVLAEKNKEYKPGEKVPASGIYTVTHDSSHLESHDVTCIKDKPFPPCNDCAHPRFKLKYKARHIGDHPSFAQPK